MNFASRFVYVGDDERQQAQNPSSNAPEPSEARISSSIPSAEGVGTLASAAAPAPSYAIPLRPAPSPASVGSGPNTNIVSLALGTLEKIGQVLTGDPVFCTGCRAVYNAESHKAVLESHEPSKGVDEAVNAPPAPSPAPAGPVNAPWRCEFCSAVNKIQLEPEEIPRENTLDYILEPAPASSATESIIIFCIDISGSMCQTQEVEGRLALKGLSQAAKLSAFNDGSFQYMPGQRQDTTWVSRLQCVQAAIESQLDALARSTPHAKVSIITFSTEVTVLGDGSQEPVHIAGDKLSNYDALLSMGVGFRVASPISASRDTLVKRLYELEEGGATALGPAMVVAIGMAAAQSGSKIVVATDGLSNVGLGALDGGPRELELAGALYRNMGVYAKSKGIAISVISIKGEGCNMQHLGQLADETAGQVQIVDPLKLHENFANILGLRFRNEGEAKTCVTRDVGNVFADSEVTFEFELKPKEEIKALNLASLTRLPFQVQIKYTKPSGMKCIRVLTETKSVTTDRAKAEAELKFNVLSNHAVYQSAVLAQRGDYVGAARNNVGYAALMERASAAPSNASPAQAAVLSGYRVVTEKFNHQLEAASARQSAPALAPAPAPAPAQANSPAAENPCYAAAPQAANPLFDDSTSEMIYQMRSTSSPMFRPS